MGEYCVSLQLGPEGNLMAAAFDFCRRAGLSSIVRPGFFLSFYFWLDTVAVLSLAFELPALRAVLLLGATQVGDRWLVSCTACK